MRRVVYKLGRVLNRGEESRALYGIMSSKKDITLRVSMTREHAELLTGCDSRHIVEVFIIN